MCGTTKMRSGDPPYRSAKFRPSRPAVKIASTLRNAADFIVSFQRRLLTQLSNVTSTQNAVRAPRAEARAEPSRNVGAAYRLTKTSGTEPRKRGVGRASGYVPRLILGRYLWRKFQEFSSTFQLRPFFVRAENQTSNSRFRRRATALNRSTM